MAKTYVKSIVSISLTDNVTFIIVCDVNGSIFTS